MRNDLLMKPRLFAAVWTVVTVLAAPSVLGAQEAPSSQSPVSSFQEPAEEAPTVPAEPAAPEPAPQPAAPPAPPPAPEPVAPAPEPAVDTEPAPARKRAKPVARAAADTGVTIKDFSFGPSSISISVGDTVTWTNQGPSEHTATGDGFDTGLLSKGQSGSHTFNEAGSFSYVCTPHPFMKGTVTVAAAAGGGSDAGSSDDSSSGSATLESTESSGTGLASNTGAEAWLLALIGTALLWLGLALQRRLADQG
jgi:plastocyanin